MALDYTVVTDIRHREGFEKGFEKGFADGFSKGFKQHSKVVAKNLLKQTNLKPKDVAAVTGISIDVVEKMKKNLKKGKK